MESVTGAACLPLPLPRPSVPKKHHVRNLEGDGGDTMVTKGDGGDTMVTTIVAAVYIYIYMKPPSARWTHVYRQPEPV